MSSVASMRSTSSTDSGSKTELLLYWEDDNSQLKLLKQIHHRLGSSVFRSPLKLGGYGKTTSFAIAIDWIVLVYRLCLRMAPMRCDGRSVGIEEFDRHGGLTRELEQLTRYCCVSGGDQGGILGYLHAPPYVALYTIGPSRLPTKRGTTHRYHHGKGGLH